MHLTTILITLGQISLPPHQEENLFLLYKACVHYNDCSKHQVKEDWIPQKPLNIFTGSSGRISSRISMFRLFQSSLPCYLIFLFLYLPSKTLALLVLNHEWSHCCFPTMMSFAQLYNFNSFTQIDGTGVPSINFHCCVLFFVDVQHLFIQRGPIGCPIFLLYCL